MRNALVALVFLLSALPLFAQGAPPQGGADLPYTMEYYYKVQWGHQQEFLQLFLKNHYPLLQKNVASGRMIAVKIETPANHMTEDARWDYRVTIKFKNSTVATTANPDEESMIKQLWPDQETYKREAQRRFEILLAQSVVNLPDGPSLLASTRTSNRACWTTTPRAAKSMLIMPTRRTSTPIAWPRWATASSLSCWTRSFSLASSSLSTPGLSCAG